MAVKIRLARRGRKKRPFYHIVVADARAPRDGRFIEKLGTYDPLTKPATIEIDRDRAYEWLMNGAQPTDTARAILRFKGILYRKHLMRGVQKGALTEEEAMAKYEAWVAEKEAKIKKRMEESKAEKHAFHAAVSGVIPKIKIKEEPVVEEATEVGETTAESESASESPTPESASATSEDSGQPPAEEAAPVEDESAATPSGEDTVTESADAPEAETEVDATPAGDSEKPAEQPEASTEETEAADAEAEAVVTEPEAPAAEASDSAAGTASEDAPDTESTDEPPAEIEGNDSNVEETADNTATEEE